MTFCVEKFKTQEKTYYLDKITIEPREIVFILITMLQCYNVVSNKSEHKYSSKTLAFVLCSIHIYAKAIIQVLTLATGFMKI